MPGRYSATAGMWIRDGVLVNRMHLNPVAFAVAYWLFTPESARRDLELESLIEFGFAKSGISCAEKMHAFNAERMHALERVDAAAEFYDVLATEAARGCSYFKGALDLLARLHGDGMRHYITSAVDQPVLDAWLASTPGRQIAPVISEVLGKRPNFTKGRDHFKFVADTVSPPERIYCVADAVQEIATVSALAAEFNLVPVGFGYVVDGGAVMQALHLVQRALPVALERNVEAAGSLMDVPLNIDKEKLHLPDREQVESSLRSAGAVFVATGGADDIMHSLSGYFDALV